MNHSLRNAICCSGFALVLALAACGGSGYGTSGMNLAIVTASLPDGTIGTAYSPTIQASGGTAPFTWSVASGALPDNVTLASSTSTSVSLSGTPDRVQAGVAFTIEVTDANGSYKTQPYSVNITSTPTVAVTQSGAVQGVIAGNLIAFRDIPFAAPPVGNLRWKAPQAAATWRGIRDASTFGNVCPQINYNNQLVGNEDCLNLNIFVPQNPPSTNMAVMVFLHGGGNQRGDGQSPPFDVPPLAAQGVVVATLEYRVGILGFLASPELTAEGGGSSGHYALLDMIAALTWVQQNIAAFGGDPAHVLLFGQSAGSFDIQFLLEAPAARGLFSAAGMESNVIPSASSAPWLISLTAAEAESAPFISAMGCTSTNAADVLGCLRAVPATTLVNYRGQVGYGPGFGSPFLPLDTFVYLQQNGSPVPLIIGSTREEWTGVRDDPNAPLDAAGYATAIHQRFDPIGAGVATQVLSLYPAISYDTPEYALIAVDSDYNMTCEVRSVARVAAGANRKPMWRYLYTHRFENNAFLNSYRAFHTAELYFIFGDYSSVFGVNYFPTTAESAFSQEMMGYWTRFAATGDPNGGGAVAWPAYNPTSTDSMLQLDDTFVTINGYHNPQCDYLVTLPQP